MRRVRAACSNNQYRAVRQVAVGEDGAEADGGPNIASGSAGRVDDDESVWKAVVFGRHVQRDALPRWIELRKRIVTNGDIGENRPLRAPVEIHQPHYWLGGSPHQQASRRHDPDSAG